MSAILRAVIALILSVLPAAAHDGIHVEDAYVRFSAHSGAVFMTIHNFAATEDRLIAARTDAAGMAMFHTNVEDAMGVMSMPDMPEGFAVPAMGTHVLTRRGDHIMLTGLTRPLQNGDTITLTLTFEHEGEVVIDVPVDNDRKDAPGGGPMTHPAEGN